MLYALASKSLLRVELSDDGHECVYDDEKNCIIYDRSLFTYFIFSFVLIHSEFLLLKLLYTRERERRRKKSRRITSSSSQALHNSSPVLERKKHRNFFSNMLDNRDHRVTSSMSNERTGSIIKWGEVSFQIEKVSRVSRWMCDDSNQI